MLILQLNRPSLFFRLNTSAWYQSSLFRTTSSGGGSTCTCCTKNAYTYNKSRKRLWKNSRRQFSTTTSSSNVTYEIALIDKKGETKFNSQTIGEILRGSSMHARDLFSLNLTSTEMSEKKMSRLRVVRPSSAILPRDDDILVAFGTIRALIGSNSGIIFDAHKPTVKLLTEDLSKTIGVIAADNDAGYSTSQDFELVFIEEILRDVCDTYARRLRIYEPIVSSVVDSLTNDMFTATGIHRLVPVKDSIQEFVIHIQSALDCLKDLLENDEDMINLMLTKKRHARNNGYDLDNSIHEDVELLIEEYARRLNAVLQETDYLLKKVETKQELIAISLDAYRNRMIRMNLYLSIAGIGIGTSTAVAGFYGMNLISGLEESPTAFLNVVFGTSVFGIFIGSACVSYISGFSMRNDTLSGINQITLLDGALTHLNSIDYAMKFMVSKQQHIDREKFTKLLSESNKVHQVQDEEIEMLFSALDATKDGILFTNDFRSLNFDKTNPREKKKEHPSE